MVQTILYVWLVLSSRVIYRQFTDFRFLSGQYQKKKIKKNLTGTTETNTNIKYHCISLRKLVKAAFFLKSQGMAKPDPFLLPCQRFRAEVSGRDGNCRERDSYEWLGWDIPNSSTCFNASVQLVWRKLLCLDWQRYSPSRWWQWPCSLCTMLAAIVDRQ